MAKRYIVFHTWSGNNPTLVELDITKETKDYYIGKESLRFEPPYFVTRIYKRTQPTYDTPQDAWDAYIKEQNQDADDLQGKLSLTKSRLEKAEKQRQEWDLESKRGQEPK